MYNLSQSRRIHVETLQRYNRLPFVGKSKDRRCSLHWRDQVQYLWTQWNSKERDLQLLPVVMLLTGLHPLLPSFPFLLQSRWGEALMSKTLLQFPTRKQSSNVTKTPYICRHAASVPIMIFMHYVRILIWLPCPRARVTCYWCCTGWRYAGVHPYLLCTPVIITHKWDIWYATDTHRCWVGPLWYGWGFVCAWPGCRLSHCRVVTQP